MVARERVGMGRTGDRKSWKKGGFIWCDPSSTDQHAAGYNNYNYYYYYCYFTTLLLHFASLLFYSTNSTFYYCTLAYCSLLLSLFTSLLLSSILLSTLALFVLLVYSNYGLKSLPPTTTTSFFSMCTCSLILLALPCQLNITQNWNIYIYICLNI
ncbi:predicted protein [Lodderomyces elongisporus NRRL YB-4239]|uniref:Uncharacterized protein n=1 Tax=Lodderomyces elongisporus (strain ATCC 11503 / CBS 2605 / JCM 1781 / NBRC 1676 / NRRL YB-4239) TaxID=379508 RepID=A5E5T6_LODEL|nr:predicted protein [Lodderomyces elongisporus NRRL YB-4239]